MASNPDYSGTHLVLLPSDFMDSIDVAVELNEDAIEAVAANLDEVDGITLKPTQRLLRSGLAGLAIWLVPTIWMICL